VRDEVQTEERLWIGWLLCRQLGFEVADDWKIRAEVLTRDASRLGTTTAVRDGDEAARLWLGPAMTRWSGGATPDSWLRTGCTGGGLAPATSSAGMRRNCSGRRPWRNAE
jgi:hypothetical protein